MVGTSWQPSHEPSHRQWKQVPVTLNKQWKEGGKGCGKLPRQCAATPNNSESSGSKHMQECLNRRAHVILVHTLMQKQLTTSEC